MWLLWEQGQQVGLHKQQQCCCSTHMALLSLAGLLSPCSYVVRAAAKYQGRVQRMQAQLWREIACGISSSSSSMLARMCLAYHKQQHPALHQTLAACACGRNFVMLTTPKDCTGALPK